MEGRPCRVFCECGMVKGGNFRAFCCTALGEKGVQSRTKRESVGPSPYSGIWKIIA